MGGSRHGADDMERAEAVDDVDRVGFADNAEGNHDFAEEHSDTTFANEMADGPEHARESDQPRGRAGMGD